MPFNAWMISGGRENLFRMTNRVDSDSLLQHLYDGLLNGVAFVSEICCAKSTMNAEIVEMKIVGNFVLYSMFRICDSGSQKSEVRSRTIFAVVVLFVSDSKAV